MIVALPSPWRVPCRADNFARSVDPGSSRADRLMVLAIASQSEMRHDDWEKYSFTVVHRPRRTNIRITIICLRYYILERLRDGEVGRK